MTPSTVEDQVRANVARYQHEHQLCDASLQEEPAAAAGCQLYALEDAPAPEVGANIAHYVRQHEDCQLYAQDGEPGI